MRFVLLALAVAACHSSPPPATPPANKAPAPSYQATADDVLGFLPADADVVIGVDMIAVRGSALWHQFAPQIEAFAREGMEKFGGLCGPNPMNTVERMTMAFKLKTPGQVNGVFVVRGVDTKTALDCTVQQTQKNGGAAQVDRGVATITYPDRPEMQMAVTVVGASTMVMHLDRNASYDTMQKLLAGGAPLRTASPAFMKLFERRERGAAVWGMANGNTPAFDELAQMGMRPQSLDGTIGVSDRFTLAFRMTMGSVDDAARIATELGKVKGPASAMVDRFDLKVEGATAAVDVVVTEPQLRAMIGMLGGAVGGP